MNLIEIGLSIIACLAYQYLSGWMARWVNKTKVMLNSAQLEAGAWAELGNRFGRLVLVGLNW